MLRHFSRVPLFAILWTVAHHFPLSVGFCRQEYWTELLCSSPGDLPNPRIKPALPVLPADSLPTEPPGKPITQAVGGLNWDYNYGLEQMALSITRPALIHLSSFVLS